MTEGTLTAAQSEALFVALDEELRKTETIGEIHLVGGAVLCLAFRTRPSTRDVDALFEPVQAVRRAAARVASTHGVPSLWLNDAAKGFASPKGSFSPFLELPNLRVLTSQPEYLLAMKCLAFRIGPEFHDETDVRFLLRYLNIERYADALAVITRYYPKERFPQKSFYALEEILDAGVATR